MAQLSRHFEPLTPPPRGGTGALFRVVQLVVLAVTFLVADHILTGGTIRKELSGEWSTLRLSVLWPERGSWIGKPLL